MSTFLIRSATFQSSSYPIALTRLGGPRSRPNPHLKLWKYHVTSKSGVRHADPQTNEYYIKREKEISNTFKHCQFNSIIIIITITIIKYAVINRSMDLWKITFISSLCSTDKLSFPSFSIFIFLLQLPISSPVSQIIKELCSSSSSSSYSFYFHHLSFNGIMKEAISSQNMTDPIGFSTQDIIQKCPLLLYTFKNLFISYFL